MGEKDRISEVPLFAGGREVPPAPSAGSNLGLWYTRFFDQYTRGAAHEPWDLHSDSKKDWIDTVTGERGDVATLNEQEARTRSLVRALGGDVRTFRTDWHFVTGLGLPHPVENGFTWHPTLGLPYLPATSVKGMLRAYVEVWDERFQEDEDAGEAAKKTVEDAKEARVASWFGAQDRSGDLIFFDALPVAPVKLALDVMTPHRGKWYAEGDQIEDVDEEPERVPADWHGPVPVPFLVVEEGTFLFAVAPRQGAAVEDEVLADVFATLEKALDEIGAGAKTAVGYGRMVRGEDENGS